MDFNQIVETYYSRKKAGSDYSDIRKALKEEGLNDSQIKAVVDAIDQKILVADRAESMLQKIKIYRLIGWLLMLVGGTLAAAFYLRWIHVKDYLFLAYIPLIVGYLLIVIARKMQKKL